MTNLSEPYTYLMDLTARRSTLRLPVRERRFTLGRAVDNIRFDQHLNNRIIRN